MTAFLSAMDWSNAALIDLGEHPSDIAKKENTSVHEVRRAVHWAHICKKVRVPERCSGIDYARHNKRMRGK